MKNLRPGHSRCICPTCGESFNSVSAFEKHRAGNYQDGRRCLSTGEMYQSGMRENNDGYWVTELNRLSRFR